MRSPSHATIPHINTVPIELCRSTLVLRITNNIKNDDFLRLNPTPSRSSDRLEYNDDSGLDILLPYEESRYRSKRNGVRRCLFFTLLAAAVMLAMNLLPF
jgi:hypothetical protein